MADPQRPVYCFEIWRADGQSANGEIGVEGITDAPMGNVVIGMNELMQSQNAFLGWRSEGSSRPLDQGPDIDMELWDQQMCN